MYLFVVGAYAGSPHSTNSPPTPSSMSVHYEGGMDGHVTPMSPNNNRPMSNPQSDINMHK